MSFDIFRALNYSHIHAVSCKYHQYVSEHAERRERVSERKQEKGSEGGEISKPCCYFDVNKKLKCCCMKYLIGVVRAAFSC